MKGLADGGWLAALLEVVSACASDSKSITKTVICQSDELWPPVARFSFSALFLRLSVLLALGSSNRWERLSTDLSTGLGVKYMLKYVLSTENAPQVFEKKHGFRGVRV